MAKSIRSKWRRKCRAVKRERYGKKELERLKKTLGIDEKQDESGDASMTEISSIANVVEKKQIHKSADESAMDTTNPNQRIFDSRTLRDQHGSYPVWVHPRKMVRKKKKGKVGKRGKKANSK